ncbi:MAG: DUF1858 domain-containing protein [Lachnospiraceae bacterium]|nr:DUF1858 domain-containing protein [Lachnospiraceae bacterium]
MSDVKVDVRVDKDMLISDIIALHPGNAAILMSSGMGCVMCPASQMETLEEAAAVHGVDADDLCDAINNFLETNEM